MTLKVIHQFQSFEMPVVYIYAALYMRSSAETTVRWRSDIGLLRSTRAVQDAYRKLTVCIQTTCHRLLIPAYSIGVPSAAFGTLGAVSWSPI